MKIILHKSSIAFIVFAVSMSCASAKETIHIMASTPYQEDNNIAYKIINECTNLGSKLSTFTQSFADKRGIEIVLEADINSSGSGRVLQLEISNAVSRGNAFMGHSKFVAVRGTLWENGKRIASFDGPRTSMGGFAAAYKSSCSVLGRCVKALGKDIAAWLDSPIDRVSLGD